MQRAGLLPFGQTSKARSVGDIVGSPVAEIVDFLLVPFTLSRLQSRPRGFTIDSIRSIGALPRAHGGRRALLMTRNKVIGLLHPTTEH